MASAENCFLFGQKTCSLVLLFSTVSFGYCKARSSTLRWRGIADSLFTGIKVFNNWTYLRISYLWLNLILLALATCLNRCSTRLTVWGWWWLKRWVCWSSSSNRWSIFLNILICGLKCMILISNYCVFGWLTRAVFWIGSRAVQLLLHILSPVDI